MTARTAPYTAVEAVTSFSNTLAGRLKLPGFALLPTLNLWEKLKNRRGRTVSANGREKEPCKLVSLRYPASVVASEIIRCGTLLCPKTYQLTVQVLLYFATVHSP